MTINRIYFAQHGLAVDKAEDVERPLSQRGVDQTEALAQALLAASTPIEHVYHSGKLRAAQTAEIFARALNISSSSAIDGLAPNDDVSLLAKKLNTDKALYVGHLPHLEKMLSHLVSGDETGNIIKFQNSAVACLEKNAASYHLLWHLIPEFFNSDKK